MIPSRLIFFLFLVLIVTHCSTVKKSDVAARVRAYLEQFERNLSADDATILAQFKIGSDANVTEEGLLKAIRVMQNREQATDSVVCTLNFKAITFQPDGSEMKVEIPVQIASLDPAMDLSEGTTLILWLASEEDEIFVSRIEAMELVYSYNNAVYELQHRKNRDRDLASRKIFFDQARMLQQTYDSVIWFTEYQDSIYYYAVNGSWKNFFIGEDTTRSKEVKMGLVSETGRVIVPVEFDMVGTIGFETADVIEVKKKGKVGQYSMAGNEIAAAVYDWIIPYTNNDAYALVKQDTVYGWLDQSYVFHAGFPSTEAEKYIREFGYLDKRVVVSHESMTMTEVLHPEHMGWGLVVPPAHFVKAKVLNEVITGIYIGENSLGWGGTESVETQGSIFEKISEKFSALMVKLNDNYLEGREGFYRRTNVTFVNQQHELIGTYELGSGIISFNKIDSALLEVRIARGSDGSSDYEEYEVNEWYAPAYRYFTMSEGTITPLDSRRNYSFTQFVKMDSSYLQGKFYHWNDDAQKNEVSALPDIAQLTRMRNEILAEYGYVFTDPKTAKSFSYRGWYNPRYARYEDFYDLMTDVDRHNLEFLEKMVGTLRVNPPS